MQLSLCPLAEYIREDCMAPKVLPWGGKLQRYKYHNSIKLEGYFIHHMIILPHKKTLQVMPTPKILSDDDKMV